MLTTETRCALFTGNDDAVHATVTSRAPAGTTEAGGQASDRTENPTMAAAVAAVSIQSASPARELTLSAQQAASQANGDRVKREEEGTGEHLYFLRFCGFNSPPLLIQTRAKTGVLTVSHQAR